MEQKYYAGLNMGTASTGLAVTDELYNLIRTHGKDFWNVNAFEEALPQEDRRGFRLGVRNLQRTRHMINYLRDQFTDELSKKDLNFLARLEESSYYAEEKKVDGKYSLFNDSNYTDQDFFNEFPTIYHLRDYLIKSDNKEDIRLIFLAIKHILGHRGHFLNENLNVEALSDLHTAFYDLNENFRTVTGEDLFQEQYLNEVSKICIQKDINKSKKLDIISELLHVNKKSAQYQCLKAIIGLSFSPILFEGEEKNADSIDFADSKYDEKMAEIEAGLDNSTKELVYYAKIFHDQLLVNAIMNGC